MSNLTPKQSAFDAAVKSWNDFDFRGIANLDYLRTQEPSRATEIDHLIQIREFFNLALSVEGQHVTGDAPHAPFYFDYIDADVAAARSFSDRYHSFIGVTLPFIDNLRRTAARLSQSPEVMARVGVPIDIEGKASTLFFWTLLGFVICHEYTHHVHAHFAEVHGNANRLLQQAIEAEADGYAVYLTLNTYVLQRGRSVIMELAGLESRSLAQQSAVSCAACVVAQAAFLLSNSASRLDAVRVYTLRHPPVITRLRLMAQYVLKFIGEFCPEARGVLTDSWYQATMTSVSACIWSREEDAAAARSQSTFLRSPEGVAYYDALLAALNDYRAKRLTKAEGTT